MRGGKAKIRELFGYPLFNCSKRELLLVTPSFDCEGIVREMFFSFLFFVGWGFIAGPSEWLNQVTWMFLEDVKNALRPLKKRGIAGLAIMRWG